LGCLALAALASAQGPDLGYNTPSAAAAIIQNQVKVSLVSPDIYFGMLGNTWGYAGIQAQGSAMTKVGIFSIWDQNDSSGNPVETTISAYNPNLSWEANGRFGGEGTGSHLQFYYTWVTGRTYRTAYRVYLDPTNSQYLYLSGFFYDSNLSSWLYVGTFHMMSQGQLIPAGWLYSFDENYGGDPGSQSVTYNNAWWCDASGNWTDCTTGYLLSNILDGPTTYNAIDTSNAGFNLVANGNSSTYIGQSNGSAVSYTQQPSEAPLYIPYLLSCGNANAVGVNSNGTGTWEADGYWSPGDWNYTYYNGTAVSTTGVSNPAPQAVYQNLRGGDNFTYNLSGLQQGKTYTIRLHFVENYDTAGQRLENVFINGSQVLSNFDIYSAAGGQFKAIVKQFTAKPDSTGKIAINFQRSSGSDWSVISGIDVH
jgi:hypothetical protein